MPGHERRKAKTRTKSIPRQKKGIPIATTKPATLCFLFVSTLIVWVWSNRHSLDLEEMNILIKDTVFWKYFQQTKPLREIFQFGVVWVFLPIYGYMKLVGIDPREHIISAQLNMIRKQGPKHEGGDHVFVDWHAISEKPAPEKEFQQALAKARGKPLALQEDCPTLGLLDIGRYDITQNLTWIALYAYVSNLLCNTSAIIKGSLDGEVSRVRMLYCLTFEYPYNPQLNVEYNVTSRKMRLLIVSLKQLKYLHDHIDLDYGLAEASSKSYWAGRWGQMRLEQLKEFASHVADTGGFRDKFEKNMNRYYGTIEIVTDSQIGESD